MFRLTAGHKNEVDNIQSEDGGARHEQRWAAAPSTSALHFNYISFLPSCLVSVTTRASFYHAAGHCIALFQMYREYI